MTRQGFLEHCKDAYGTSPDYPFDDLFETAVLRHADNRKWYALVMKISRKKFGFDSDETVDVVNLKLPTEMFGSQSFSAARESRKRRITSDFPPRIHSAKRSNPISDSRPKNILKY